MILTGPRILEEVRKGNITIEPFDQALINPNSCDFRLGDCVKVYKGRVLDTRKVNKTTTVRIPESGMELSPATLYLGHTFEAIGSNVYVPVIRGKSSTGRLGLFIHITADLVDIGFCGQLTLMLHAVQPIRIYPRMRIGQVTFWKVAGSIDLYIVPNKWQNG